MPGFQLTGAAAGRIQESIVRESIDFKAILNSTSNGVITTDADGHITFVNRTAERILDFGTTSVQGKYIADILPMTGALVIKCLQTGEPQLGGQIFGRHLKLVVNITILESGGRTSGTVCNFQKMRQFEDTARQLASYKRLNRQLATIIGASSDGIWVCDGRGRVISINAASEKLNGIRAQEIVGRNVSEIVESGIVDRSVTLEVLATHRQVSVMQYVKKTNRYLLATGTPSFDEEGNLFLVVVNERDMTQLNAIREALEQSHLMNRKIKDELAQLNLIEFQKRKIVAESPEMRRILKAALKLAHIKCSNILILGESGTGKGLLARFIHHQSFGGKKPFIQINCAALPENLLEAELFGYEKGAFTGAREQGKVGLIELAAEGTLFLDEIGDLPLSLQAKLLKYLDDKEVLRLGGTKPIKVDCTVITATNQDLVARVRKRHFRKDLFYRLNTFTLEIPPLRQRSEDIFELVNSFLSHYNKTYHVHRRISPTAMKMLLGYAFPGNIRELKNLVKKAVVMSEKPVLDESAFRIFGGSMCVEKNTPDKPFKRQINLKAEIQKTEKKLLQTALQHCRSTREMAGYLKTSQPTIVRKLKKHNLCTN